MDPLAHANAMLFNMCFVIELLDSRVPLSSRNPDIDELAKGKARIILLNKYFGVLV